ncbi:hypothetical protein [Devosia salina]|uniref:Ribbon-helix-helix protein, copG family n=1 Tax=Devosia salina TaxID=2860336 RepID=A0ABX8WCW2_9HYPH|nr:hypothetical protein [Devosia salina]QYO76541.1 hypothetical protein K1X15_18435 [Devosia salina]
MAGRGSETRRKSHSVLVRLTMAEHDRLTGLADREGATRAEYLRRRMRDPASPPNESGGLSESDRVLLAGLTRSMGHVAGLMKLTMLKTPAIGPSASVRAILAAHHRDLQDLQAQVRTLLERVT